MEQEIRFIRADDTRIGAAIVGAGPPLVLTCWWVGHLEAQWEQPEFRAFLEELARDRTVIRYDRPGAGLSGPLTAGDDVAGETSVLAAVVADLAGGRADVLGGSSGSCAAVALAATRPELVDRLILYGGYVDGSAIATPAVRDSLDALVRAHWGLGATTLADLFMPDSDAAARDDFARYQRRAATADEAADLLQLAYRLDASPYLADVGAPTLVLHRTGDRAIPIEHGRRLAQAIPGARFVPLPGRSHFPWIGDSAAMLRAVRAFLGSAPAETPADESPLSGREREVLALIATGLSDADIAAQLVLSPHTVHRHVANVRRKLRQPSRAAAVAEAARLGLI